MTTYDDNPPTLFDDPLNSQTMTQKERVLKELRHRRVVCGDWFLRYHIPRYAARISELRAEGYDIVTVKCPWHYHNHTGALASYELRTP